MQRVWLGLAGLLAAAGCAKSGVTPQKSMVLAEGAITATAPAGYCIDPAGSNGPGGFAVMAACASMGSDDTPPDTLAVATVQVGSADSATVEGEEDALISFLESEAGAVLLHSDGDPEQIEVLGTRSDENTVTVHFSDAGPAPIDGLAGEEWRAFTDIGGRLVTVAVRGLKEAPLTEGTGSWLLNLVVTGLVSVGEAPSIETSDT